MEDSVSKDIKTVIDNWVTAIQQKNLEGILKNHPSDILMFDVPEPLQAKRMKEYKKTWELFFQYNPGGKNSFRLEDLQIHSNDSLAFCTALIKLPGRDEPQCRLTLGLKEINDQWMIVHEHHSAPHKIA